MAISFDKAFGIHPDALLARSRRAELLSSNIANADTPGYKAKDLDFQQALEQAKSNYSTKMTATHHKHFDLKSSHQPEVKYRVAHQPDTGDGNSVDVQMERNKFVENAMEYQASLRFLNGKISGLKKALTGGGGK
ncbi:flagellar basal body rod protein FlgB [Flocculibacter collagenilyticus]|uniref:flagellar basal body rod protein FlgB n=1 Tax=Flocculibacter collagenilyticus TaxID=2744479 RepID=UPI0018F4D5C7|nr:flagellar basal body rod protein FlgB [Flocculibacter collagenilyticus]